MARGTASCALGQWSSTATVSFDDPLGVTLPRGRDIYEAGANASSSSLRVYFAYDADVTRSWARAITALCAAMLACSIRLRG